MDNKIIIYHGSISIIEKPTYGFGKKYNDFGLGFYCTDDIELAKEWAVNEKDNGYANIYELNLDGLKILDLTNNYNVLNWITILLINRSFITKRNIAQQGKDFLISNFKIPYEDYDIIIGYRADDAYFTFAEDFLNNTISLNQLEYALKLGKLGKQIVLKSKKAFEQIKYIGNEIANYNVYYIKRRNRNINAKLEYLNRKDKISNDDIFLNELIKKGVK